MPIYDLGCKNCGHEWEDHHRMVDPHPNCPRCGAKGQNRFEDGNVLLDGVSQNHWPRGDYAIAKSVPDGRGGFKDREFRNRREMRKYAKDHRIELESPV